MKKLSIIIFFLTLILILIGLVVVLTASSSVSAMRHSDSFYLFRLHLSKVIWALPALLIASVIPYEFYKYLSKYLMIGIVVVLFLTLFFAVEVKGAGRWISLFGFKFQPADAAKLFLIMHLAYLMDKKEEYLDNLYNGFLPLLIWVLIVSGLIFFQPNVSNAVLIFITSLILIFVGGASFKHVFTTAFVFAILAFGFAMTFSHAKERIETYVNALVTGGYVNVQVKQAIVSLGSGGVFGVGIGNSRQNNLFLPEAYGDFIFGILGEQFGLIGTLSVLLIYLFLIFSGILIAKKTYDKFGQLLAFGIITQIGLYALINIIVTVGLLPTTGLPLPFISYGGTSIIFNSIGIGIIINIAFTNYIRELERKKYGLETIRNSNEQSAKQI